MDREAAFLPRPQFQSLLDVLHAAGYQCLGPQVRDGAIVFDLLEHVDDLPYGVTDTQSPGHYRLDDSNSDRCFHWAIGPQAIKPHIFSPREKLWSVQKDAHNGLKFTMQEAVVKPMAMIGVRACDLAALFLQDKHFLHGDHKDPWYLRRRQSLFLVAVHCTRSADTCFCVSTGDGPHAAYGYDLALSELDQGFIVEGRSERGQELLARLPTHPVDPAQAESAGDEIERAAESQRRGLPSRDLRQALFGNLEHPRWEETAQRCLSCGNCASVCPTCFCHREGEDTALDGKYSDHYREWDSCFTQGHSYIHGLTVRQDTRLRYRQWLTHKLGSWHDQYGRSGCVGCGRCITWCPVGIDITEEAAAICG